MDRRQLLDRLELPWRDFLAAREGLPEAQLIEPGVTGAWSVKDLIAHVTIWEQEALKYLPLIAEGGRPPRYASVGGIDAFNAREVGERGALALAEVLAQAKDVHERLVAYIEGVPEALFLTDTRFRRRLRLDTYSHYPEHTAAIREWRESASFVASI